MKNKQFIKYLRSKPECGASFYQRILYCLCLDRSLTTGQIKEATGWHYQTIANTTAELEQAGMVEVKSDKVSAVVAKLTDWFVGSNSFIAIYMPVKQIKLNRAAVYSLLWSVARGERTTKPLTIQYITKCFNLDPDTVRASLDDLEAINLIRRFPSPNRDSFIVGLQNQPDLFLDVAKVEYAGLTEWLAETAETPSVHTPPTNTLWPETLAIMLADSCALHFSRSAIQYAFENNYTETEFGAYMKYARYSRLQEISKGKDTPKDYTALLRHVLTTYAYADIIIMLEKVEAEERKAREAAMWREYTSQIATAEGERLTQEQQKLALARKEHHAKLVVNYADAMTAPLDSNYYRLRFNDPRPSNHSGHYTQYQTAPAWIGQEQILREVAASYPCLHDDDGKKRGRWEDFNRQVADRLFASKMDDTDLWCGTLQSW